MFRRRLGIRGLFALSSAILACVTVIALVVLLGTTAVFRQSLDVVARDSRSAAIADEIEVTTLLYQRLANLYLIAPDPGLLEAKADLATQIARLMEQAANLVGDAAEQALIDRLSVVLDEYLQLRARLEATTQDVEDVIDQASPVLSALLVQLTELRQLNDLELEIAHRDARRAQQLSRIFGIAAGALLIIGLLCLGVLVNRHLSRPVLALHTAVAGFRRGDTSVRGAVTGAREVAELTQMFNEMADTIARQRQAQLAFLGGVAHDLKNPLATLRNGIHLLALDTSTDHRGRVRASLDGQIEQMARMVDDVMDAARIEAGALQLRCVEFDVRHLITDLVRGYAVTTSNHRLIARTPSYAVSLVADPMRIEQVLRNLIANAIKYSAGGDIVVSADVAGEFARIRVSDQGEGITDAEMSDLFLPFRRRRMSDAPGFGLGLSVVKRIVESHCGGIDVWSRPGAGSTFSVILPVRGPASAASRPTDPCSWPACDTRDLSARLSIGGGTTGVLRQLGPEAE